MKTLHRTRAVQAILATAAAGTLLTGVAVAQSGGDSESAHHPAPADEQEIRDLFEDWNDALATGDPEAVADLYAGNAVLEPTQSNVIRTDRDGIVDYFEHFLAQQPVGQINESYVELLGPDAAVDSGAYTFTLTDPETGTVADVAARYSFVYERDEATGEWRIVNHHSSAMPEG
ncbi:SgcJ/EcaC family oxidoreductase [Streptomyces sedi]|uniref:SgcJ/EcaC family oxidoreductase n=1 Tax=Streptomyces sedi TaxID=555059 RepID=A0A5C4VDQ2_9ACTN|nr:SgcJ/EcaC family oxidoreductase [Streptomyces sedi]TNM33546.1 SgcJ/EcaC family oxidoreductase [Streptomyces sedi]